MPFEVFAKGALDIESDGDDFVARVVELSDEGKVAELAISSFADHKGNQLGGATYTKVQDTGSRDADGHRIVRITSDYPQMVEDAANSVCARVRGCLFNLKREWTAESETFQRLLCKSIVDKDGGNAADIDKMMDEFHSTRRERLRRYWDQKQHGSNIGDGGDSSQSGDEHGTVSGKRVE